MPVVVQADIRRPTQQEFGAIAYEVINVVFAVHNELGRFLEEEIYQREIAHRLPAATIEVPITVCFDGFSKTYFLDMLVESVAPFELKAVEKLTHRHRAQLLNYLLLMELPHGKLVNLRPESVEHEFVNSSLRRGDRTTFDVQADDWNAVVAGERDVCDWLVALLQDIGTGLDVHLYGEACTHFFGGPDRVLGEADIVVDGRRLGSQRVRLAAPGVAFKITALSPDSWPPFEDHSRRFLQHTSLRAIHWINITRKAVRFRTIQKERRQKNG